MADTRKKWLAGFYAGVCSALACIAAQDGPDSVLWCETIQACGGSELADFAEAEGDVYAEQIRTTATELERRRHKETVNG